jgi:gamma-glutamylcyclotransferase (GGCT)/AIG2-like uncharacterized protein YtfP
MSPPNVQGLNSMTRREGPQKVFVYGTLKKGYGNHEYHLKGCEDLGPAEVEGLMFHLGGCPAISLYEPFGKIRGEVYQVTWDHILGMDQLEGVGRGFYDRVQTKVEPHGAAWTYVFPYKKASQQEWVIPSGVWTGRDSIRAKWLGFGKGIEVGSFETNLLDEIKVGPGESDFILRRFSVDNTYKLLNKKTGEIMGSYKHLRNMIGRNGVQKPVLSLPSISRPTIQIGETVSDAVSQMIRNPPAAPTQIHPNIPILWVPDDDGRAELSPPKEESVPQAMRLLGFKYGAA